MKNKTHSIPSMFAGLCQRSGMRYAATKTLAACTIALGTTLMMPEVAEAKPKQDDAKVKLRSTRGRMPEMSVELTDTGKQFLTKYAGLRDALRADIQSQLPATNDNQLSQLQQTLARIEKAQDSIASGERQLKNFLTYERALQNVKVAEQAITNGPNVIAASQAYLDYAQALPDDHEDKEWVVKEAEKTLANRKRDLGDKFPKNLAKAQADLAKAEKGRQDEAANLAKLQKAVEDARAELEQARAAGMKLVGDAGLMNVLTSDKLDTQLARFMVINETQPYWMAAYAQQGSEHAARIERLLGNTPLMLRMLAADGAAWEKFPKAMEIYENIQQTSPRAKDGVFERLALAVSLEHAQPLPESNSNQNGFGEPHTENTTYIDPVERYQHYEKAWLDGELDHHFDKHDVWSLRMCVDSYQTSEYLAWGRQMLRDYRPDLVTLPNEKMRYSKVVAEEIQYSAFFLKNWSRSDLERMQSGLATGGICGLRAHFGGFILNAFGVPTTPRGQRGHAALVRFTPDGWVPYLGAGWGANNREIRGYRSDSDFRASTEARRDPENFVAVKRAQWIGKAVGEQHAAGWGFQEGKRWKKNKNGPPPVEYWNAVACLVQEGVISRLKMNVLEAIGEDIGEADEAIGGGAMAAVEIPASERKATVDAAGVIRIPAAATSYPRGPNEQILFMESNLGGVQLHFRRYGSGERFEYTIDAPKAGKYLLTSRLVTPAWKQSMDLSINGGSSQSIALPYTMGVWGELEPVEVELREGTNVLNFSRRHHFFRGVSIKDFTLTPVK